ncbi:hypothetical protein BDV97DRAFT_371122 [Delphinella strobiligena]|nr:hypothetical protein BDV97DRAFT_371122 [Delphinella strobiligena]
MCANYIPMITMRKSSRFPQIDLSARRSNSEGQFLGPRGQMGPTLTTRMLGVVGHPQFPKAGTTVELFINRQYKCCNNKSSNSEIDETASGFSAAACSRSPVLQNFLQSIVVICAECAPLRTPVDGTVVEVSWSLRREIVLQISTDISWGLRDWACRLSAFVTSTSGDLVY